MNHNPHSFKIGDEVVLDADFNNSSIVTIKDISPIGLFSLVADEESSWMVMTSRLSPIKTDDSKHLLNND